MTRFNLDNTYVLPFEATNAACFVYHIATFIVIQHISNCTSSIPLKTKKELFYLKELVFYNSDVIGSIFVNESLQ
jgi:hypothetical protein